MPSQSLLFLVDRPTRVPLYTRMQLCKLLLRIDWLIPFLLRSLGSQTRVRWRLNPQVRNNEFSEELSLRIAVRIRCVSKLACDKLWCGLRSTVDKLSSRHQQQRLANEFLFVPCFKIDHFGKHKPHTNGKLVPRFTGSRLHAVPLQNNLLYSIHIRYESHKKRLLFVAFQPDRLIDNYTIFLYARKLI